MSERFYVVRCCTTIHVLYLYTLRSLASSKAYTELFFSFAASVSRI
jgi:hypothetical protein